MRTGKRNRGRLLAAAPCLLLCAALLFPQAKLQARDRVDENRSCTLTVTVSRIVSEEEENWEELNRSEIRVDVYRVADMELYGNYHPLEPFAKLGLEHVGDGQEVTAGLWQEKAEQAAEIIRGQKEEQGVPYRTMVLREGVGAKETLPRGMYLIWAQEVQTAEYTYTFLPNLISLPDSDYYDAQGAPSGPDVWLYDVETGLKPRQEPRYGELEIRKRLPVYDVSLGTAVFGFAVEARRDMDRDGSAEIVYSNVVSLDFAAPGEQSVRIGPLPAGSEVTVREVYSGSSYRKVSVRPEGGKVTVLAEGAQGSPVTVDFENEYDGEHRYGTGVTNRFTYDEDKKEWTGAELPENRGGESR